MSEKLPRVPENVPKLVRLVRLNAEFGAANWGSLVTLFTSQRTLNFSLSRIGKSLDSESCVQRSPGASNKLRPAEPSVKAAGDWCSVRP